MNETTPFDGTSKIPTLTSVYPPKTPDATAMPDRERALHRRFPLILQTDLCLARAVHPTDC